MTATLLDVPAKVLAALCHLGFRRRNAAAAIERVRASEPALEAEQLLRRSLLLLVPAPN
jgi:Holliday junction resolvasome RuvABC DNA-binding subunit